MTDPERAFGAFVKLFDQTFEVKKNLKGYFATLVIKLFQSSKLWKSCTHG
jgi:hypothetical protein